MKRLRAEYNKRRKLIRKRLKGFRNNYKRNDERIFEELCFCLLTPQSKAVNCDKAIRKLKRTNLLFEGSAHSIKQHLRKSVRFHNKKAAYLVGAREVFKKGGKLNLKDKLNAKNAFKTREWLVKNIKGLGHKEASHFLRNVGLGGDIAVLDRHILRNLERLGIIEETPASITKKDYIDIENKMRKFAGKIKIPLEEIDLLFWSCETGFVFK